MSHYLEQLFASTCFRLAFKRYHTSHLLTFLGLCISLKCIGEVPDLQARALGWTLGIFGVGPSWVEKVYDRRFSQWMAA